MQQRLVEVLAEADRIRAELLALIGPLSDTQWAMRDREDRWSVGEVVAHLQLVEDGSVRALFRAFRTARDAGLGQESSTESLVHSLDRFNLTEPVRPIEAPPMVQPKPIEREELMTRLARSREGMHTWAAEASGFALGEVSWPHPAVGPLNLYQWVLFIGQHEARHVGQIRRILAA
jgi:uncharacterized damage-inducible protein DinB